jgi:hypothetical protein
LKRRGGCILGQDSRGVAQHAPEWRKSLVDQIRGDDQCIDRDANRRIEEHEIASIDGLIGDPRRELRRLRELFSQYSDPVTIAPERSFMHQDRITKERVEGEFACEPRQGVCRVGS